MSRDLPVSLLILVSTFSATAQTKQRTPAAPVTTSWPQEYSSDVYGHTDIITTTDPTRRQHCERVHVSSDAVTCDQAHNRRATTYNRADVLALISPPSHANFRCGLTVVAIASGALAASFFVPLGWSIVLRIVTFYALEAGAWGCGDGEPVGHSDDKVVYQKEGSALSIPLRGHPAH